MDERTFIQDYLKKYKKSILEADVSNELIEMKKILLGIKENGRKVIIAGNGGSASIASHVAVDLTKQGGIRTINFNEPDLITCFANDYGYSEWISKAIEFYADEGDLIILISSSGSSKNIVNAAKVAKKLKISVITFTGFDFNNPLKKEGLLNFWVDSFSYNIVENTHQIWLLMVCDLLIGNTEYSA
ncbi:MAG: phosphoheptose isomerase [Nitrospinae bacterium]|nr:phosphoheptose isomerase [Nitrospinota bacterium]